MNNNLQRKLLLPMLFPFFLFNTLWVAKKLLAKWGLDSDVLMMANCLFFFLALLVFFIQQKALQNSNPNVFVRSVMAGMMIKMAVVLIAVILYRLLMKDSFSKMSVFAAMFIYFVYLIIEVRLVTKLVKTNNA